jgi:hypothetical protein
LAQGIHQASRSWRMVVKPTGLPRRKEVYSFPHSPYSLSISRQNA